MKIFLFLCLAVVAVTPVHAQMFRPEAAHRNSGRTHASNSRGSDYVYRHSSNHRGHDHSRGHFIAPRHFHGHTHSHRSYVRVPSFGYYSSYGYGYPYYGSYGYYRTGSSAVNGLVLGALAGGIIGHNSGDFRHNGWRGVAWGAGAGWLLGSVIEANRTPVVYSQPAPMIVQQPAFMNQPQPQPAQSQPQQVTVINNYYGGATPMSGVNGMFGR